MSVDFPICRYSEGTYGGLRDRYKCASFRGFDCSLLEEAGFLGKGYGDTFFLWYVGWVCGDEDRLEGYYDSYHADGPRIRDVSRGEVWAGVRCDSWWWYARDYFYNTFAYGSVIRHCVGCVRGA